MSFKNKVWGLCWVFSFSPGLCSLEKCACGVISTKSYYIASLHYVSQHFQSGMSSEWRLKFYPKQIFFAMLLHCFFYVLYHDINALSHLKMTYNLNSHPTLNLTNSVNKPNMKAPSHFILLLQVFGLPGLLLSNFTMLEKPQISQNVLCLQIIHYGKNVLRS